MMELIKQIGINVPGIMAGYLLLLYFVDSVLKYQLNNRKKSFIVMGIFGLLVGVLISLFYFNPPSEGFFARFGPEAEFEVNITSVTEDLVELIEMFMNLFVFIILAISIKAKTWQKLVVSGLSISIHSEFSMLFSFLKDTIMGMIGQGNERSLLAVGIGYLFIILEIILFVNIAKLRSKHDNVPMPIRVLLLANLVFGLFLSVFAESMYSEADNNTLRVVTIVFLLMTLAGTLIFFYIRASQKERAQLQNDNTANEQLIAAQTGYFEASARADKEIRAMRHDMKNNIQVLALLLENNEYDKMREYLEELGENLKSTDLRAHTGNTIADAIIADKQLKAADLGITLNVSGNIKGVEISSVDMCKILANILDNAIEATSDPALSELSSEIRTIILDFRSTGNFFMISSSNPTKACPQIEDGYISTSKKDKANHGFGIRNIRSAASNYDGEVSVYCEPKPYGGTFNIEVMIPLNLSQT